MSEDVQDDSGYKYYAGKKPFRTYVSKRIRVTDNPVTGEMRDLRYISKVLDSEKEYQSVPVQEKSNVTLRVTPGGRQEVLAKVYEDDRTIRVLTIQRYSKANGSPIQQGFSFVGEEVKKLKEFLESIAYLDLSSEEKFRIEDSDLSKVRKIIQDHVDLLEGDDLDFVIELAEKKVTKEDVVALAYRKEQLEIFHKLLEDDEFFNAMKTAWLKKLPEHVWQKFFEDNLWIFGCGLNYQFLEVSGGQVYVGGKTRTNRGGQVIDFMGYTKSELAKFTILVEIKMHNSSLLGSEYRRNSSYSTSNELSGSINQLLHATHTWVNDGSHVQGNTDENEYQYLPKGLLIIGHQSELDNKQKIASFELFRKSMHNIEIVTYDELYRRAEFIVKQRESGKVVLPQSIQEEVEHTAASESEIKAEDLPF